MAKHTQRVPAAGYSNTPLWSKLGIKPGARVRLLSAPDGFEKLLVALPPGARLLRRGDGPFDVALVFAVTAKQLTQRFAAAAAALGPGGRLWVAWPKKTSGVTTELTEDRLRELLLTTGWVDYKVCAIDATWSALCFGRRRT